METPVAETQVTETQVAIIGAGPAGLVLSHLLQREGIASVILESRTRAYVQQRVRAGVLEQGTVDLLDELGLSERLHREGLVHHGLLLTLDERRYRIALTELAGGRALTVYGQQEVVKDLIAARLASGGEIQFEVEEVRLEGIDGEHPRVRYRHGGAERELRCAFIAGCDGFHGVTRPSIPPGVLTVHERHYPFAWLGILAAVAPSTEELIYARHTRGFALHSLRSPEVSRLYIQVDRAAQLDDWSDDRIWEELRLRLAADGFVLRDGPVIEKSIALHHSFVVEPMQFGRLFLAGDAAHIVPPTGAKGLNLAVADVWVLSRALADFFRDTAVEGLQRYSERCLRRVWRAQEFSSTLTTLLHNLPDADAFQDRVTRAQLAWLCTSETAARAFAENYVGLPLDHFL
jgi:p-hydroxybenzoate 3-monooxygenase